jgi:AraC-like DNA-binding protein
MPSTANPDFEYLANSPVLGEVAALVKRLTGLALALNAPGVTQILLPDGAGASNPLCHLIDSTPEGNARCRACDRRHHAHAAAMGRSLLYTCHAGLLDLAVPIFVDGRHVATISSGQVLPEPHSPEGEQSLRESLSWLDVSDEVFDEAYRQAVYLPRSHVQDVMRLIEVFTSELCANARRIRSLEARLERDEIRRAREYIEHHCHDRRLGLPAIAKAAGLSPSYLSRLFRQETGSTLSRSIQCRRIDEAKRLLANTERSVTSICFACGFGTLTHFNRVFRQFERCSPRQYRQREEG